MAQTTTTDNAEAAPHRIGGDERRRALVQAAFEAIAERGFEGLRTREVAARAGVNIATLHYYFPSKEDLIGSVRDYLTEFFMTQHAPGYSREGAALARLRHEFADTRFYLTKYPETFVVLDELHLRARRDPAVRAIFEHLEPYWYMTLEDIMYAGLREGVFRADLDPPAAASVVMAFLKGIQSPFLDNFDFDAAYAEIERWLTVKEE